MSLTGSLDGAAIAARNQLAPWLPTLIATVVLVVWAVVVVGSFVMEIEPVVAAGAQAPFMLVLGGIFGRMVFERKNGDGEG